MVAERDKDRRHRRADSLRRYAGQYAEALTALNEVYGGGAQTRAQFSVRRSLILRSRSPDTPTETPSSPSPVARLVTQKGWALHLYLIAIFEAQCRRRPGSSVQNTRALTGTDGQPGWVDLLPAATATVDRAAGGMRQMKRALTLLSHANLVQLSRPSGTANRFERFQLLIESGLSDRLGRCEHYHYLRLDDSDPFQDYRPIVAKAGQAQTMLVPSAFFLRGWVHVLSAAEIVIYLMIRDLETRYPQSSKNGAYVASRFRKDWYGISRDVYESHQQLAAYGLIERLDDPNRSADGKILRQPGGRKFLPALRFRTLAGGLRRYAHETVTVALTRT